jgi:nucleoside-diphosphate-sugar epimerase
MKILLTGSTGFIGRHLLLRLTAEGHTVLCSRRGDNVYASFEAGHPEVIIHCAGEVKNSNKMFESNVDLTYQLLLCAKHFDSGYCKFISLGSSSEYGPTNEIRTESMLCHPSDLYETTKLAATVLCQGYAAMGVDACVVRPFSVYGSGLQTNRFMSVLYRSFLGGDPIDLHPGAHDWIYIDDFIQGVMTLLSQPSQVTKRQIFNLGTGISTPNKEIVWLFERLLDTKANVHYTDIKSHSYDVKNWQADISKMKILGWEPRVTLEEGIKRFIDFQKANP